MRRIRKRIGERTGVGRETEISYELPAGIKLVKRSSLKDLGAPNEPQKLEKIIDHYCADELNYLGSGWISLRKWVRPPGFLEWEYGDFSESENDVIDWNRDQRTGFKYAPAGKPGDELKKAFATPGVDVKFCWEFARMHHLPQLALAYSHFVERQQDILKTVEKHIESFTEQCRPGQGIHYTSPMEVSIRLLNILVAYDALNSQLHHLEARVLKMAYAHFKFISCHLEDKDGFGTNHYLSNLMGLVVAGYFLKSDEVAQTSKWAWGEMEKELQKQFSKDGFNFEYSTYYHRLSTEIAIVTARYAKLQGFEINVAISKILDKAIHTLELLMKGNSELPKFGDIDSGRILDLDPEGSYENGEFFTKPEGCRFITDLSRKGTTYYHFYSTILTISKESLLKQSLNKSTSSRTVRSLSYSQSWEITFPEISTEKIEYYHWPKSGLVLYKSKDFYLAINLLSSADGHRYRGHSHNDKGAFELRVHGKDYVMDPGVLSYTATTEIRNKYRQTAAHPIPYTGIEQNRYLEGFLGLFHSRLDVKTKIIKMNHNSLECEITYRGVKTVRRFEIKDTRLVILDWCNRPFTVNKNNEVPLTAGYGKLL